MKKKTGVILLGIGVAFLINAIFGRYLVLPGYLQSLETMSLTGQNVRQTAPLWGIIRYLLWAYSYKLGIFFMILGASLNAGMNAGRFRLFLIGGLAYVIFAYIPLPAHALFFGIGGGVITLLLLFIAHYWTKARQHLEDGQKTATDYRMAGYFFFAMATYNLCPLMGVKAFALQPEKMIRYGMQSEAASFATHIMIELMLGWICIFLSERQNNHKSLTLYGGDAYKQNIDESGCNLF